MNKHVKTIKMDRYLQALYCFGFYPLCMLIEEYEKHEDYEECQYIFEAIKYHNKHIKDDLPAKYDKEAKKYLKKVRENMGLNKDFQYSMMLPYYIEEIKRMAKH